MPSVNAYCLYLAVQHIFVETYSTLTVEYSTYSTLYLEVEQLLIRKTYTARVYIL